MIDPNQVFFFDTTLRDGEQAAGVNLNAAEKLQIAHQLAKLKMDVIEAGFPAASPGDFTCVETIAKEVKGITVAGLARAKESDIKAVIDAVKEAEKGRIHVFLATSALHMEYKLKMTQEQVLEATKQSITFAKASKNEIEFSAEDASRSDIDFLIKVFKVAIDAGATILNIPDTVGYAIPEEFAKFIKTIIKEVKAPQNVIYSVHAHNDLGLAVANSLAAVKAGVRQIEGTINGMGERGGNAALEEVVMALKTREDFYNIKTRMDTTRLFPVSRLVSTLSGVIVPPNKPVVGKNAFAHQSGIHQHGILANRETYEIMKAEDVGSIPAVLVLGKHSGTHAFKDRLEFLGYNLSDADINKAFVCFKSLCDDKKDVTDGDIEAIIANEILAVTPEFQYKLKDFSVHVGAGINTAAIVIYDKDGNELKDAATGNGAIDAAYQAIKRIVDLPLELESFKITATSQKSDAMGETQIIIKCGEIKTNGRGVSTDIIQASIRAYINGINRLYTVAAARGLSLNGK